MVYNLYLFFKYLLQQVLLMPRRVLLVEYNYEI